MGIGVQHMKAILDYEQAHPEVDWTNNTVIGSVDKQTRELTIVGHRELTQADRESFASLDMCCCHPDLPRHHD